MLPVRVATRSLLLLPLSTLKLFARVTWKTRQTCCPPCDGRSVCQRACRRTEAMHRGPADSKLATDAVPAAHETADLVSSRCAHRRRSPGPKTLASCAASAVTGTMQASQSNGFRYLHIMSSAYFFSSCSRSWSWSWSSAAVEAQHQGLANLGTIEISAGKCRLTGHRAIDLLHSVDLDLESDRRPQACIGVLLGFPSAASGISFKALANAMRNGKFRPVPLNSTVYWRSRAARSAQ